MKVHHEDERVTLWHGDALDVLRELPDASVDAVVTDPPYGLEFMGKDWDAPWQGKAKTEFNRIEKGDLGGFTALPNHDRVNNVKCANCNRWRFSSNPCKCDKPKFPNARAEAMRAFQDWCLEWATECLRVLKPGGHLLAFGGTRTWHRLACAVEDAGFEVRDSIAWLYGSGFPKSLDVSKAIDKAAGAEREVVGTKLGLPGYSLTDGNGDHRTYSRGLGNTGSGEAECAITAPATPEAERWQGWGTALKPSHEPVVVARKPHVIGCILDGIGSELTRLEDECRPSANGAARSSAPTPAASPEARTATAPASAATPHEAGQEPTTPTGAAAGSSAQTATSWSDETTAPTPWSTVSSWRACWAELCELTSTSTTSTTTEVTTDLRTLWSSISSLTVTSTPDSPTPALTSGSTASAVDSLFAATVLRLRATLALSATESATGSTPHVPQAAGGSSAFEPIVVARKPLVGTVAANVLAHGTGALNIDACRVALQPGEAPKGSGALSGMYQTGGFSTYAELVEAAERGDRTPDGRNTAAAVLRRAQETWKAGSETPPAGRWPTNVVLDDSQAAELDRQSGESSSKSGGRTTNALGVMNDDGWQAKDLPRTGHDDQGGASRFFPTFRYEAKAPTSERPRVNGVAHPTVKPLDLMRWLVRLVTPPGGTVLEPFAGSGTTVEAALVEGFNCIAIEREADYLPLVMQRVNRRRDPVAYIQQAGEDLGLFDLEGEGA